MRDSIHYRNGRPYTFLQYVCVCLKFGRDCSPLQALVAKCLAYGAHINIQDEWGNTALHCFPATLETLCFAGAKLHIRDRNGATPLDKTVGRVIECLHSTPCALYCGHHCATESALLQGYAYAARCDAMLWTPQMRRSVVTE